MNTKNVPPLHPLTPSPSHRTLGARLLTWSVALGVVLLVSSLLGVTLGSTSIPFSLSAKALLGHLPFLSSLLVGIPNETRAIIQEIRLPRVILAGLVGAGLSVSGAALQGLLGNPLADPYVIGVSSGAAVGAALVLALGYGGALGGMAAPAAAFLTALLAMALVLSLSRRGGRLPVQGFLLAGIVVGSFFWALVTLVLTLSGRDLQSVLFWLTGSFSGADWPRIGVTALCIGGGRAGAARVCQRPEPVGDRRGTREAPGRERGSDEVDRGCPCSPGDRRRRSGVGSHRVCGTDGSAHHPPPGGAGPSCAAPGFGPVGSVVPHPRRHRIPNGFWRNRDSGGVDYGVVGRAVLLYGPSPPDEGLTKEGGGGVGTHRGCDGPVNGSVAGW